MQLETFEDVYQSMKNNSNREFHLLLGNGFSMAYDPGIFSYNALHDFVAEMNDDDLSKILSVVDTKNFELVMRHLDHLASLVEIFDGGDVLINKIESASEKLKSSLLEAVRALHPEHVFTITDDDCSACAKFINLFIGRRGKVFSTNYDLLLYWVLMRSPGIRHIDGCGKDLLNYEPGIEEQDKEFSELYWGPNKTDQNVFYLHGALPFFDAKTSIVKEEYDSSEYLLQRISNRMERGEYPVFVTAGDGDEKLTHIRHNQYLSHCFDSLTELTGSLVTFGFNFGEYDTHIIGAINQAAKNGQKDFPKLVSVYIGVYSDEDKRHIERIQGQFKVKVRIFDAKTANIWGRD